MVNSSPSPLVSSGFVLVFLRGFFLLPNSHTAILEKLLQMKKTRDSWVSYELTRVVFTDYKLKSLDI